MYSLATFYKSNEWVNLLNIIKNERINKQGFIICEYCGKPIVKKYDCIGHHENPLTENNVNDLTVSLNPDNVVLVHHGCHNKIHDRFSNGTRHIYIVYGAPCAGKSSFVCDSAGRGDIVVDIDSIWKMISTNEPYIKPWELRDNVFAVRDMLIDMIKVRRGNWRSAWIVGGYPFKSERERMVSILGAEEIFIDTSIDECLSRASERPKEWRGYIEEYFKQLT